MRLAATAVLLALGAWGCFQAKRYAIPRPGLDCERAMRVAHRTMVEIGYTVTEMIRAEPFRVGLIKGTKPAPDGSTMVGRVRIDCDGQGVELQPIEDSPFPDFEFSRLFGYSFKSLVQRPDVEDPTVARGLQLQVRHVDRFQARLDLGGEPIAGDQVLMRVTIRNDTDRALAIDPDGVDLVTVDGTATAPLAGAARDAALAPGSAGASVRADLLGTERVAPHTVVTRWLVFPAGRYREARVGIVDVETDETEGFVAPVQ